MASVQTIAAAGATIGPASTSASSSSATVLAATSASVTDLSGLRMPSVPALSHAFQKEHASPLIKEGTVAGLKAIREDEAYAKTVVREITAIW